MNNNNNNNKTKFILNYQTPFLHYLLSFLMIIIAISFITFAYYLFQHKQNILENDIKIQTQYLNDLKFIKQHKICKIYNNKTLHNLTEKLHNEYSKYSLKFAFTNSNFAENYLNTNPVMILESVDNMILQEDIKSKAKQIIEKIKQAYFSNKSI